jgi:hypothetical protein
MSLFVLQMAAQSPGVLDVILDNVLALTILFIFASAVLGAFLGTRARDRCLKDFDRYHITVEEQDGDAAWGRLRVYSTGFELEYDSEHRDLDGHIETSHVVYEKEFANLYALYRYHDQLTPRNQERRLSEIRKTYRPSLFRRMGRKCRNVFNTLRDAFSSSLDAFIGSTKKTSKLMSNQGGKVSEMSKGIMGHFGNAYDPILERFVGKRVVVETSKDGKTIEVPGILKEYSSKFMELLAVRLSGPAMVPMNGEKSPVPDIEVHREGLRVVLKNRSREVVHVIRVMGRNYEQSIGALAVPEGEVAFTLNEEGISQPRLILQLARDFDMVIPRAHAFVRHGGKREKVDWKTFLLGGDRVEFEKTLRERSKES